MYEQFIGFFLQISIFLEGSDSVAVIHWLKGIDYVVKSVLGALI